MIRSKAFYQYLLLIIPLLLSSCGGGSSSPEEPPVVKNGQITVNINGLDEGVDADVFVSSRINGISAVIHLTQTKTLTRLVAGTYKIASVKVSKDLKEYLPGGQSVSDVFDVILAEGESLSIDVNYQVRDITPATIQVNIDSSALPADASFPPVTLIGPEGFSQEVINSELIGGLVPGVYRLIAPDFQSLNQSYGFYLDFGAFDFRLNEGDEKISNMIFNPIPVRIKSVTIQPIETVTGIADNLGNYYTVYQQSIYLTDNSRYFLKKWDSQGLLIQTTEITQAFSYWTWKITTDQEGNVYLAGNEEEGNLIDILIQNLPSELYKYNKNGQLQWKKNLPGLAGGTFSRIDAFAVQDGKVVIFASLKPLNGFSPREALIEVVEASTGDIINSISDSSITTDDFNLFTQLKPVENRGYWIFAKDRINQYSSDGNLIQTLTTGRGFFSIENSSYIGVKFQPDEVGGLYVLISVERNNKSDAQISHYDENLSVIWQQTISNDKELFISSLAYDASSEMLLLKLDTSGTFPGFLANENGRSNGLVISEWSNLGEQQWLYQHSDSTGSVLSMKREKISGDWILLSDREKGGGQYGIGNRFVIGP